MKDRTMLTIERDKLVKKVKELEKELNEMKEAQKKRKEEENEKKKKAKTITTTNGGSVASKIATRVKATEHGIAKEDASSTPSSSASLLKSLNRERRNTQNHGLSSRKKPKKIRDGRSLTKPRAQRKQPFWKSALLKRRKKR